MSPASCKGPGLRQFYGTTCEGGGVGGLMFAGRRRAVKWVVGVPEVGGVRGASLAPGLRTGNCMGFHTGMGSSRRDHYVAPLVDADTASVFDAAVVALSEARGFGRVGDPGTVLHVLASLAREVEARVSVGVADARAQDYSWAQIGDLLGVTRASAQQRFGGDR